MHISLDLVPSTVHQAAELLANSLSDNEREYFRITPVETLVGNFGLSLRQGWSLWEETPLRYDAARHYWIAHPDDISSLIIHWARAMVTDEPFFPQSHCVQYHEHWASLGKTSLEAGGWKDG